MRIDLLEAFGLDPNVIAILKRKYGERLLLIQERAFKECRILNGGNFLVFAIASSGKTLFGEILALFYGSKGKRVFYLVPTKALAQQLSHVLNLPPAAVAALARDILWHPRTIEKISALSQRLIYGVTEKGLALSKIRLRGLGRTYINCLVDESYDTPKAISRRQQFEGL